MRLVIAAIGRMKSGPEATLVQDYAARASQAGRPLALGPLEIAEAEAPVAGDKPREAALLRKLTPPGAAIVALDERGASWTSRQLAERLAGWRDQGRPAICFWIGGPDGTDPDLRTEADALLAFGTQTWPHKLVRVMLAEQLYRATSILACGPYHRD